MKLRFRFSLRTLLIGITLSGIVMSWITYQLQWIHARHDFLENHHGGRALFLCSVNQPAPWHLRIFGERGFGHQTISVEQEYLDEAKQLFPEVQYFRALKPGEFDWLEGAN